MNALLVLFWASFLCLIISLITLTFPTIYPRKYIKNGSKKIQIISLIIYIIICSFQNHISDDSIELIPIIPIKKALHPIYRTKDCTSAVPPN